MKLGRQDGREALTGAIERVGPDRPKDRPWLLLALGQSFLRGSDIEPQEASRLVSQVVEEAPNISAPVLQEIRRVCGEVWSGSSRPGRAVADVTLSPDVAARLRELAAARRQSQSALIADAIRALPDPEDQMARMRAFCGIIWGGEGQAWSRQVDEIVYAEAPNASRAS